jgi:hypothetical protein
MVRTVCVKADSGGMSASTYTACQHRRVVLLGAAQRSAGRCDGLKHQAQSRLGSIDRCSTLLLNGNPPISLVLRDAQLMRCRADLVTKYQSCRRDQCE